MKRTVNNPILNDFVYTLLYTASYEEKRGLKGKYLRAAISGESAKRFATNSTREEKEFILSHFGIQFFYVIAKQKNVTMVRMKELLAKFEGDKRIAALRDMAEMGLFVTSDKELIRLLGYMSQSIHHHTFFLNMEFLRQGYHIQNWKRQNVNEADMQTREADESAKVLAKTMLKTCLAMEYVDGMTHVSQTQMKILLRLYPISHTYINDPELYNYFSGNFNKTKFRHAMNGLLKDQLILQKGKASKKEYTISGAGIKHVNNFFDTVINTL
jgi:hypothetical protein